MHLTLVKLDQTENSTVSKMFIGSTVFLGFIIEDGEHENKIHGKTRIPGGTYRMVKDRTTKFTYQWGYCWQILNVPEFSEIKIHKGNTIAHTEGCLLPNTQIGHTGNDWYGVNSKTTYDRMMSLLKAEDEHFINIIR